MQGTAVPPGAPPVHEHFHAGNALLAGAPGETFRDKARTACLRALRTLLQGLAGAFPAAGAGTAIVSATYWESFGFAVLAAVIAAIVSFLQNVASFLPEDPTQRRP